MAPQRHLDDGSINPDWLAWVDARLASVDQSAGHGVEDVGGPHGIQLREPEAESHWVRITEVDAGETPPRHGVEEVYRNSLATTPYDWAVRQGGLILKLDEGAWAVESMGQTAAVDDVVLVVKDASGRWVFTQSTSSGGGGGDEQGVDSCADCGWLRDSFVLQQKALRLTIPTSLGRCDCIDGDQGDGEEVFRLCYDALEALWVGNRAFETCCGCGKIELELDQAATRLIDIPTLTLTINKGCTSETSFSLIADLACCTSGTEENGPTAVFVGYGPEACNADEDITEPLICENLFRVRLECEDTNCESDRTCECTLCTPNGCCEEGSTAKNWKLTASGFSGGSCTLYNGDWYLEYDGGCNWFLADGCSDTVSITLEYVSAVDPEDSVMRLTFSGSTDEVYELQANEWNCCEGNILDRIGSTCSGGPATITVEPVWCAGATCCVNPTCDICEETDPLWAHFSSTISGVGDTLQLNSSVTTTGCHWIGGLLTDCGSGAVNFSIEVRCDNKTTWTARVTTAPFPGPGGASVHDVTLNVWQLSPFIGSFCYTASGADCGSGAIEVLLGSLEATPPTIPDGGDPCGPVPCDEPAEMLMLSSPPAEARAVRVQQPKVLHEGPGKELTGLIDSVGFTMKSGCGCKSMARKMNQWGVAGCREHRAEIVSFLETNRAKAKWWEIVQAGLLAVSSGLAFRLDPRDVAGSLVDEAIRLATLKSGD